MGAIDIGNIGWSRYAGAGETRVSPVNSANDSGEITSVSVGGWNTAPNVKVGCWSASGNTLTCRDYESLGNIAAPGTYSGLHITVVTGDYIGCYHTYQSNNYIGNENGQNGWKLAGDHTEDGAKDFGAQQTFLCPSISGIGTTVAAGWSNIAKTLDVASADMAKILGVAVADVAKLDGVAVFRLLKELFRRTKCERKILAGYLSK